MHPISVDAHVPTETESQMLCVPLTDAPAAAAFMTATATGRISVPTSQAGDALHLAPARSVPQCKFEREFIPSHSYERTYHHPYHYSKLLVFAKVSLGILNSAWFVLLCVQTGVRGNSMRSVIMP